MSLAEIERFAADLKADEALRAEAGTAPAGTSRATPMERVAAFAASKGYAFTADEAKAHATAKELTDAELAGVAGGVSVGELDRQKAIESDRADAMARAKAGATANIANASTSEFVDAYRKAMESLMTKPFAGD